MDLDKFRQSLQHDDPPAGLDAALTALWWDAKGEWNKAHETAQQDEGPAGSWVHAYLHRKEGDSTNAAYWYGRADRKVARGTFQKEWARIVEELLATGSATEPREPVG